MYTVRPNEAYGKYLRLLASIMIMIQLFLPVGRFLLGRGGQEAAEILQQFKRELELGMENAAESAAAADALMEQMTLEEVQRRLEEASQGEAGMGSGMDEDGEPVQGSTTNRSVETGQGSGMDEDGEPVQGSGTNRSVETGQGSGMDRDGEMGQGGSMSREEDTSSWDGGENAIQIEEIEPVLIDPIR